jgi:hypothetical protein
MTEDILNGCAWIVVLSGTLTILALAVMCVVFAVTIVRDFFR